MNAQGVPAENGTLKVPDAREPGESPEGDEGRELGISSGLYIHTYIHIYIYILYVYTSHYIYIYMYICIFLFLYLYIISM